MIIFFRKVTVSFLYTSVGAYVIRILFRIEIKPVLTFVSIAMFDRFPKAMYKLTVNI